MAENARSFSSSSKSGRTRDLLPQRSTLFSAATVGVRSGRRARSSMSSGSIDSALPRPRSGFTSVMKSKTSARRAASRAAAFMRRPSSVRG